MNILVMTIPVALTIGLIFLLLFIISAKKGEFDDLETPAHTPLLDDLDIEPLEEKTSTQFKESSQGRLG